MAELSIVEGTLGRRFELHSHSMSSPTPCARFFPSLDLQNGFSPKPDHFSRDCKLSAYGLDLAHKYVLS